MVNAECHAAHGDDGDGVGDDGDGGGDDGDGGGDDGDGGEDDGNDDLPTEIMAQRYFSQISSVGN